MARDKKTISELSAPVRTRNAAATRAAILESASAAFARSGYDGAGVREIAAGAGVTAMLVNRYFGSKESLFAEVAAASMARPLILAPENLQSGPASAAMAKVLVQITEAGATPLNGFQIMLRSAASQRAAEIGREEIEKGHLKVLTESLSGELAPQRAALVLGLVAGVQVMRQMIELSPLADADPEDLVRLLTPVFQDLLRPPPAADGTS